MCPDGIEPQCLCSAVRLHASTRAAGRRLTARTSSSLIDPETSLLFLNTSRLAPVKRCSALARPVTSAPHDLPLRGAALPVPCGSRPFALGPWHRRPILGCRSSRSNSSSRSSASSGRQRPLCCGQPVSTGDVVEGDGTRTDVEFVACRHISARLPNIGAAATNPSYSMVLMMKPRVGLTLLMSSFMILLTMVVLPALSSPLGRNRLNLRLQDRDGLDLQHQNPHLLVLQPSFAQDGQHSGGCTQSAVQLTLTLAMKMLR